MFRLAAPVALAAGLVAAFVLAAPRRPLQPDTKYTLTPLVSNVPGLAPVTDPNVENAWGLSAAAKSPGGSPTTAPTSRPSTRAPARSSRSAGRTAERPGAPTGAVFSGIAGQFQVATDAAPTTLATSNFIFAAEDGTISAWLGAPSALVTVPATAGTSFKGLAISNGAPGPRLYATDFDNGRVDVFDGGFNNVTAPGGFVDPELTDGFAPFGIQAIGATSSSPTRTGGRAGTRSTSQGAGIVDVTT